MITNNKITWGFQSALLGTSQYSCNSLVYDARNNHSGIDMNMIYHMSTPAGSLMHPL